MVKIEEYKILFNHDYGKLSKEVTKYCQNGYITSGSLQITMGSTSHNYFQAVIKIDQSTLTDADGAVLLDFLRPKG